ncbi:helix-turn-helix domain-containing protein [Oscillatoria sp. HE19RPO]|uniref:helix-turn-helix domain-containing protein n=1 Tax=Oscillatoria sp. HE19RPO TaxID=2954806 RepID=UPI0020C4DA78|nr:helix-turn-helix domain-containing protein [Oscillatoria sp. HE19RPO]
MPQPIGKREQRIIRSYCQCQLSMTPWEFYQKWEVTQETIAEICGRSPSQVRRWFAQTHQPTANDMRHLALLNFLLEHHEEIPDHLRSWLCLTN